MNSAIRDAALRAVLVAAMLGLSACGGGAGTADNPPPPPTSTPPDPVEPPVAEPTTGLVGIFITDNDTERFDQILVDVNKIDLLGDGRPVTVLDEEVTIDLKQLESNGELLSIADDVPPGFYNEVRLYVDEVTLVTLAADGSVDEAINPKLPSGKLKLKPRAPFEVVAGESLLIQIDIDANKSVKFHQKGNGEWQFRPVAYVDIGDADDFGRLTRIYGRIDEIFDGENSFRICQTELLSDDDDDDDYDRDEHCVLVNVFDDTGLFGSTGDPIGFMDLVEEEFATVAGLVQNRDDDDYDEDERRREDDDDDDYDDDSDDDDSDDGDSDDDEADDDKDGSDDSSSTHDDDDDENGHGAPFEIDAVVVMQGEKGTFSTYKGLVVDSLNTATGDFSIDLDPNQGIETDGPLAALFQDGTRVFDRKGNPLDPTAIAMGVRGQFEGRLMISDSDPDILKTTLIVLDMLPGGDEILRGIIGSFTDGGFNLMTDLGDRCVWTDKKTEVLLIVPDGDGIRSEPGSLDDLESGQEVDVYGDYDDGCFDADAIVVDLTVDPVPPGNQSPMADAGPDQTVDFGDGVTLDGSGSSDPEGDPLTYAWALTTPGGSMASLSGADTEMPTFVTDVVGDYIAELTVDDGEFSDSDSVTITAIDPNANQPPTADAGPDQFVKTGDTVTLDGSMSSDPNDDTLTYSWTLNAPPGSAASLDDATIAAPSFIADVAGPYRAMLVVNDGTADSAPDEVLITAEDPVIVPPPVESLDGEQLYNDNCTGSGCHGSFAGAGNWSAERIQNAIDQNRGGMGILDLPAEEIQAIADALAAR